MKARRKRRRHSCRVTGHLRRPQTDGCTRRGRRAGGASVAGPPKERADRSMRACEASRVSGRAGCSGGSPPNGPGSACTSRTPRRRSAAGRFGTAGGPVPFWEPRSIGRGTGLRIRPVRRLSGRHGGGRLGFLRLRRFPGRRGLGTGRRRREPARGPAPSVPSADARPGDYRVARGHLPAPKEGWEVRRGKPRLMGHQQLIRAALPPRWRTGVRPRRGRPPCPPGCPRRSGPASARPCPAGRAARPARQPRRPG
ncbi:hypothetical protein STBA_28490 [Streptomyces sp. MP131-18]|nr:hypothetical protein STBA_28490 [Streptomyces sp. MP131-18]